jgi:hypothetical protein
MSSVIEVRYVNRRFTEMLQAAMPAEKIDLVKAPAGVTDQTGKLLIRHLIVYPIPTASSEASFTDPHAIVGFEMQVTAFGRTADEAGFLADACTAVVVGKTNNQWTYSLSLPTDYCCNRTVSLFGAPSSDAPGTFTVQNSYRLDVS